MPDCIACTATKLDRHIPVEERLPMDAAAPCLEHLLGKPESNGKATVAKGETKPISPPKKRDQAPKSDYIAPW